MTHHHSTVAVFNTHTCAEAAIRRWSEVGFPIERLGIICKGYETGEQVVDCFNLGERVKLKGNNTCIKSPCVFSSSCAEVREGNAPNCGAEFNPLRFTKSPQRGPKAGARCASDV